MSSSVPRVKAYYEVDWVLRRMIGVESDPDVDEDEEEGPKEGPGFDAKEGPVQKK